MIPNPEIKSQISFFIFLFIELLFNNNKCQKISLKYLYEDRLNKFYKVFLSSVFLYFCTMRSNNILHQIISVLVIVVYMISLLPHIILHNHSDDHSHDDCHHASHELSFCDNLFKEADYKTNCSHQSHVINLKEGCHICDHFTVSDKAVFANIIQYGTVFVNIDIIEKYQPIYLHDNTTYLNKSPPYIS